MKKLMETIQTRLAGGGRLLLAIDGRCGCGKSTLAAQLRAAFGGSVFHTDDFYLPFAARAEDWREGIAGNMDLMRLRAEVLEPLRRGESVHYRAYDCPNDRFFPTRELPFLPLSIVEGSYSQHPLLRELYDLRLFVTAPPAVQRERLRRRESENYSSFEALWIPMEERYFAAFSIPERADYLVETGEDGKKALLRAGKSDTI